MMATITGEVVTRFMFGSHGGLKGMRGIHIPIMIKYLTPEVFEEVMTPQVLVFGLKVIRAS